MKETLAQLRAPGLNTKNGSPNCWEGLAPRWWHPGPGSADDPSGAGQPHLEGADRDLVAAAMAGSLGLFLPLVGRRLGGERCRSGAGCQAPSAASPVSCVSV